MSPAFLIPDSLALSTTAHSHLRITEYAGLEGSHQDHRGKLLAAVQICESVGSSFFGPEGNHYHLTFSFQSSTFPTLILQPQVTG